MNGAAPETAGRPDPRREPVHVLSPVFDLLARADLLAHGELPSFEGSVHMGALAQLAQAQLTHRSAVALERIASNVARVTEILNDEVVTEGTKGEGEVRRTARELAFKQLVARLGLDTRPDLRADIVAVFNQLAVESGDHEQRFGE